MDKIAAVIPAGGPRNAYVAGMWEGADLKASQFDAFIASSSGAALAAYIIAGQESLAETMWVDRLTSPNLFSYSRMILRVGAVDINYLIDHCCHDLNIQAILKSSVRLFVGIYCIPRNVTYYPEITRESDWKKILKASCALPGLARPVELWFGEKYADGGTQDVLPISQAIARGYTKILVFDNHPWCLLRPLSPLQRKYAFPFTPHGQQTLLKREAQYTKEKQLAHNPPEGVQIKLLYPTKILPADRCPHTQSDVRKNIEMGRMDGTKHKEQIHEFLAQS